MNKKFELTKKSIDFLGRKLFQIKAIKDFGIVKKGELGGFIEKEDNLSQEGNAWVYGNARVYGDAWVSGDAEVFGNVRVYGDAWVYGDARVYGDAWVSGDAEVFSNARVYGDAWVYGDARVDGKLEIKTGFYFGMQFKGQEIKKTKMKDDDYILWKD